MDADLRSVERNEALELVQVIAPHEFECMLTVLDQTHHFWAGFIDGACCSVIGIITPSMLAEEAYLWLLHDSTLVYENRICFARRSGPFVQQLLNLWPVIKGHTDEHAVKWLAWLGADIGDPEGAFFPFEFRRAT